MLGYTGAGAARLAPTLNDRQGTLHAAATATLVAPTLAAALELEHVIGFAPQLNGLAFVSDVVNPAAGSRGTGAGVLYCAGRLLVFHDLHDCHGQRLLRGHDAPVTAVATSPLGGYFASGQREAVDRKVYLNVWDAGAVTVKHRLITPHNGFVELARFSPDDAMLASTGAEGGVCVWDSASGSLVASHRDTISGDQARGLCWGEIRSPGARDQSYVMYVAFHTGVRICTLSFSLKRLTFDLDVRVCAMPGAGGRMGGFARRYTCCDTLYGDLLCGSSTGDVLVFQASSGTYRAALSVCSGGVAGVVACPSYGCCVVAGGDGTLRKLVPDEHSKAWCVVLHTNLGAGIAAVCRSFDEHQLIVMTTAGTLVRVLTKDFANVVAAEAPLGAVHDLCVPPDRADVFCSASSDGVVRVWDLNAYAVVSSIASPNGACTAQFATSFAGGAGGNIHNPMEPLKADTALNPVPTAVAFVPGTGAGYAVTGWSDGKIRGIDFRAAAGVTQWTQPAHRGAVAHVSVSPTYILTSGSDDSVLRVWSIATRELAGQMQDHKAPVSSCAIDRSTDLIIHSAGRDMALFSYDISRVDPAPNSKNCRRVASHGYAAGGAFTCMAQRVDHEREAIVGTAEGRLLFFDLDVPEPVLVVEDRARSRVTCLAVAPSGRHLAAGSADGTLSVYELFQHDGTVIAPALQAACHSGAVARVQWTCDNRQVISAGADGEVIVWNFFSSPAAASAPAA
jgi:WD40 repeat protein